MTKTPVYLSDLSREKQSPAFLGGSITRLIDKADELDCEIIVGYYLERPELEL